MFFIAFCFVQYMPKMRFPILKNNQPIVIPMQTQEICLKAKTQLLKDNRLKKRYVPQYSCIYMGRK